MDNNASERAIRGFCIGKKNWEMIDTIHGATSSAIIYSIAETAKANNLKPYDYFEYLLTEIPKHVEDKNTGFLEELNYCPGQKHYPSISESQRKQVMNDWTAKAVLSLSRYSCFTVYSKSGMVNRHYLHPHQARILVSDSCNRLVQSLYCGLGSG